MHALKSYSVIIINKRTTGITDDFQGGGPSNKDRKDISGFVIYVLKSSQHLQIACFVRFVRCIGIRYVYMIESSKSL